MNWALIWAAVTAIGTVLAGLALPLAFIQFGALRQDRLRAQVSKVGAWVGTPAEASPAPAEMGKVAGVWNIPLSIRNGSELPVQVDAVDLAIRSWGYVSLPVTREATGEIEFFMDKKFGNWDKANIAPGMIAPGDTMSFPYRYVQEVVFGWSRPPMATITRVVVTDAAGYQWEIRSGKAGPARRVQRWRRWRWKRHGAV